MDPYPRGEGGIGEGDLHGAGQKVRALVLLMEASLPPSRLGEPQEDGGGGWHHLVLGEVPLNGGQGFLQRGVPVPDPQRKGLQEEAEDRALTGRREATPSIPGRPGPTVRWL